MYRDNPWYSIAAEIESHREAGNIADPTAMRYGRPGWIVLCTCGRAFLGRTLQAAGNRLAVHGSLERTGRPDRCALAGEGEIPFPPVPEPAPPSRGWFRWRLRWWGS